MRLFSQVVGLILLLVLAGMALYLGRLLISANDQTRIAVLTAAVSVVGLIYTQNRNAKREIESRHFSEKAAVYEDIISTIGNLFKEQKGWSKPLKQDALAKKLFDIKTRLMVWAGPEVLTAWQGIKNMNGEPGDNLSKSNALFAALRAELGHRNDRNLGRLGLIRIYLTAEGQADLDKS